jgi:hypothetical protein
VLVYVTREFRRLQGQTDVVLSDDVVYIDEEEIGDALVESEKAGKPEDVERALSVSEGAFDCRDVGDVVLGTCGKAAAITRAGVCSSRNSIEK